MRVIAGSARHLNLITPPGDGTRPTLDREKETLFNMLGPGLNNKTFLDLFSGSGQIAIEALSRGALSAVLVENQSTAISCIKTNLEKTKLDDKARVLNKDVFSALLELKGSVFDYIFMDPPYNKELEKSVLSKLKEYQLLDEDSLVIIEASSETDFSYLDEYGFSLIKEKCYKTNKHVFVELKV